MTEKKVDTSFETAFQRLEQIVEKMNDPAISLDEAMQLFEEGDALIVSCQKKLQQAEQRVEILLKNRANELQLNSQGKPQTTPLQIT
jgi:exodeoxyribonuclease VII small subunit